MKKLGRLGSDLYRRIELRHFVMNTHILQSLATDVRCKLGSRFCNATTEPETRHSNGNDVGELQAASKQLCSPSLKRTWLEKPTMRSATTTVCQAWHSLLLEIPQICVPCTPARHASLGRFGVKSQHPSISYTPSFCKEDPKT